MMNKTEYFKLMIICQTYNLIKVWKMWYYHIFKTHLTNNHQFKIYVRFVEMTCRRNEIVDEINLSTKRIIWRCGVDEMTCRRLDPNHCGIVTLWVNACICKRNRMVQIYRDDILDAYVIPYAGTISDFLLQEGNTQTRSHTTVIVDDYLQ